MTASRNLSFYRSRPILALAILAGLLAACTTPTAAAPIDTPTVAAIAAPSATPENLKVFSIELSGAKTMMFGQKGDPEGIGSGTISVNPDTGEICWDYTVSGITLPAVQAHIHQGPEGQVGPIVLDLTAPDADGRARGCATDKDLAPKIIAGPAGFAVLVHTTDFPNGSVRSQLAPFAP